MRSLSGLLVVLLVLWACDSGPTAGAGMGTVSVVLASAPASASSAEGTLFAEDPAGSLGAHVSQINVSVTRVEALPAGADEDGYGWIPLSVADGPLSLDLMALASAEVTLVSEQLLPAGTYGNLRLFLEAASVFLAGEDPICLGGTSVPGETSGRPCVDPGEHANVQFPSGEQTGIKTGAHFSIDSDVEAEDPVTVTLEFDEAATVRSVTWSPGLEMIVISPVIRAADEAGG